MGLTFDFNGLLKELESIDNKVQNIIAEEALIEGAKPVLQEQKKLVPKGKTKNLLKSLEVDKIKKAKGIKKINIGIGEKDYEAIRYGFYQNVGTRRMMGKYFLEKSIRNTKKEAIEIMANVIAKQLGK